MANLSWNLYVPVQDAATSRLKLGHAVFKYAEIWKSTFHRSAAGCEHSSKLVHLCFSGLAKAVQAYPFDPIDKRLPQAVDLLTLGSDGLPKQKEAFKNALTGLQREHLQGVLAASF